MCYDVSQCYTEISDALDLIYWKMYISTWLFYINTMNNEFSPWWFHSPPWPGIWQNIIGLYLSLWVGRTVLTFNGMPAIVQTEEAELTVSIFLQVCYAVHWYYVNGSSKHAVVRDRSQRKHVLDFTFLDRYHHLIWGDLLIRTGQKKNIGKQ